MNSHESLSNYYMTNFNIMFNLGDRKFDPIAWESTLLPFERQLYLEMLTEKLEKETTAPRPVGMSEPSKEEFEE